MAALSAARERENRSRTLEYVHYARKPLCTALVDIEKGFSSALNAHSGQPQTFCVQRSSLNASGE